MVRIRIGSGLDPDSIRSSDPDRDSPTLSPKKRKEIIPRVPVGLKASPRV
jgi:hypothetical protein